VAAATKPAQAKDLAGFEIGSQDVQVTAGGQHWASMGIAPNDSSAEITLFVIDRETGAPIVNATAQATGNGIAQSANDGSVRFSVNAGAVLLSASAEGYLANKSHRLLQKAKNLIKSKDQKKKVDPTRKR